MGSLFPEYLNYIEDSDDLYDAKPAYEACICKICMENPANCVLLGIINYEEYYILLITTIVECGHVGTCTVCSKYLVDCPFCRRKISRVVQTYYV